MTDLIDYLKDKLAKADVCDCLNPDDYDYLPVGTRVMKLGGPCPVHPNARLDLVRGGYGYMRIGGRRSGPSDDRRRSRRPN